MFCLHGRECTEVTRLSSTTRDGLDPVLISTLTATEHLWPTDGDLCKETAGRCKLGRPEFRNPVSRRRMSLCVNNGGSLLEPEKKYNPCKSLSSGQTCCNIKSTPTIDSGSLLDEHLSLAEFLATKAVDMDERVPIRVSYHAVK